LASAACAAVPAAPVSLLCAKPSPHPAKYIAIPAIKAFEELAIADFISVPCFSWAPLNRNTDIHSGYFQPAA
jgi:hypothetical protein